MSKNALALVDCNNREQLFQFLVERFDRKASKNEMVSPYDEQLIGKMNFRYGGMDHAMFFTYARSSEYPGKRFRNHRILYLSLGVNEISSDIFRQICGQFGGFIDYNDELENGWEKIERLKTAEDLWMEKTVAEAAPEEKQPEQQKARLASKPEAADEDSGERERREPRRREPRHEKGERKKPEASRGQREEQKDVARRENKHHSRPRNGSRTGNKKREPKAADKQNKAVESEA